MPPRKMLGFAKVVCLGLMIVDFYMDLGLTRQRKIFTSGVKTAQLLARKNCSFGTRM